MSKIINGTSGIKRHRNGDKIFYAINALILGLLAVIIIYPLYFIIIASFSDPDAVLGGKVVFFPVNITLDGYKKTIARLEK